MGAFGAFLASAPLATIVRKDTTSESTPGQRRWNADQGPRQSKGHDRLMNIVPPDPETPQEVPGQILSHSRATLPGRVAAKLFREGDCFIWKGALRDGYGAVGVWEDGRSKALLVHRVVYELVKGPIPEGLWIDHLCRNRACANPYHLEVVAPGENSRRGKVFMLPEVCRNGHPWEPGSFVVRPNGNRRCLECRRAWKRAKAASA